MTKIKVTLNDAMGDDLEVVKAAKVSFDADEDVQPQGWEDVSVGCLHREQPILTDKQRGLIRYLVRGMPTAEYEDMIAAMAMYPESIPDLLWKFRNTPLHAAPFGHCFMSFTVEAPVFVARQLVKHEYLRMSEVSRRYIKGEPEYYMPDNWSGIADNVKQGAGTPLEFDRNVQAITVADMAIENSDGAYRDLLDFVAPEEARMVLPLCHMTRWRWSGSLDAFMNMCKMRLDSHAQSATREVARQIGDYIKQLYPQSWASYVEGDV